MNLKCNQGQACAVVGDCVSGVCLSKICAAAACGDGVRNGTETDVDCGGGSCPPCDVPKMCGTSGANCVSGVCTSGKCVAPLCTDNVKNGTETDKDCGGSCATATTPKKCTAGQGCLVAADCADGVCGAGNLCQAHSCSDGVKNGDESDVDCGGSCLTSSNKVCAVGKMCGTSGANCAQGVCKSGVCAPATCTDMTKNGMEIGVDCGAVSGCPLCPAGQPCGTGADCSSGSCVANVCAAPSCTDLIKNGLETDKDCGGGGGASMCPRCAAGGACLVNTDYCNATTHLCTAPTCTDGVKNGSESDVDCGAICAPMTCANGKMCVANGDCTSANCASLTCSVLGCQTCWKVQYKNTAGNVQWSDQSFNIKAIGTTTVPLSQLTIRYWFDVDGQTLNLPPICNWASIGCGNITMQFVQVTPARTGATHYLEVAFKAGTLNAGSETGELQASFHYNPWANVNRTNDYSFDGTKTALADWTKVTLYHNGNKVWGVEPP